MKKTPTIDRDAIMAAARVQVEKDWEAVEARQAIDAEASRQIVREHREMQRVRAERAQAQTAAHAVTTTSGDETEMATTVKTKSKKTSVAREPIVYPTGAASYWHMHKTGPTHSGVVKGTTLTTACGKKLNASGPGGNYWRPIAGRKVDCAKCIEALGGQPASKGAVKVGTSKPAPKPTSKGKGAVRNYTGKAKAKTVKTNGNGHQGIGTGEPTP